MKFKFYVGCFILCCLGLASCDDYLDKTPESDVTTEDVFGSYPSFQGFVDVLYTKIMDYNSHRIVTSFNIGGDVISIVTHSSGNKGNDGDYFQILNNAYIIPIEGWPGNNDGSGIYTDGWRGIRIANIALENLHYLVNTTEEEKRLIEGQAYFFRAFFHLEMIKSFGGLPYIDKLLLSDDPLNYPRLTYQETTEKIVSDLSRAAELLPEDWDFTLVGGERPGANTGRATKGAALAFKAKALLFAGSPLMNKYSGFDYTYNTSYMERAAKAAYEVIKLADKGIYSLVPMSNYRDNFAKDDGTQPWTSETIFQKQRKPNSGTGFNEMRLRHGRLFSPARFEGIRNTETVNQLYVDRFEMLDGTRYKPEYDSDNTLRWDYRDPRFRQNILVDRDKWGNHPLTVLNMYEGPDSDKNTTQGITTPYVIKKFWPFGVNKYDGIPRVWRYVTPYLRLADIYLIYAEAVNEAYGADGSVPGTTFSAVDALNVVRSRAGMPNVTSSADGYSSFRDLVWNERCVELCFEGKYWFDIRRWYVGHLPEYKSIVDLSFDKDWTSFSRSVVKERVFDDPKHYWMPLPREQTLLYKEYYQNPGW